VGAKGFIGDMGIGIGVPMFMGWFIGDIGIGIIGPVGKMPPVCGGAMKGLGIGLICIGLIIGIPVDIGMPVDIGIIGLIIGMPVDGGMVLEAKYIDWPLIKKNGCGANVVEYIVVVYCGGGCTIGRTCEE